MSFKSLILSRKKILVIGDLMLDEYWIGTTNRISPEAPVPIVLLKQKDYRAGGAANVALNVAGLGSEVDLMGIAGEDENGKILDKLIALNPNINNLIHKHSEHPTINKLRIISNNQQLFRIDQEQAFTYKQFNQLLENFEKLVKQHRYDLILLSDYNKGSLQQLNKFITIANKYFIPVIVDPKNLNIASYQNATILTPNLSEFKKMANISENLELTEEELSNQGHQLIQMLKLKGLIITRGKQGLTVLTADKQDQHFAAYSREVFDVTGAGDTVIATLAVALANNYNLTQAAHLATIAAGIAVSKLGTYAVSWQEITKELEQINSSEHNALSLGIVTEQQLIPIIAQRKALGEKIVLVNGCFDILHAGHIQYLNAAKSYGDRLIVAVNTDDSIKVLKGQDRPINKLAERMEVLAALKCVDWVVAFGSSEEIRPGRITAALNPDVLIKSKETFKNIIDIPEHEGGPQILSKGGEIYLLERPLNPDCQISSTKIINNIKDAIILEGVNNE